VIRLPLLMDPPQPETRQKARRVVERQVMYLGRLVDDLLSGITATAGDLVSSAEPESTRQSKKAIASRSF